MVTLPGQQQRQRDGAAFELCVWGLQLIAAEDMLGETR